MYYAGAIAKVKVACLLGFLRKSGLVEGRSRSAARSGLDCLKLLMDKGLGQIWLV
ncbi:MAG: hypothetical protein WBA43_00480 [Elainellaceae cyanobacterium]